MFDDKNTEILNTEMHSYLDDFIQTSLLMDMYMKMIYHIITSVNYYIHTLY